MNSNRKNIIFLTMVSINNIEERGLYQDFIREMSNYHNIYVVTPNERRFNQNTELLDLDHIKILSVKTGNLTQTKSNIEKGISTLSLEYRYLKAMKKYFKNIKFDWVIYSTPPIKFNKIISYYKRNYNIKTYLMLKDIFPQNAVDLEMISENGIIHRFFRKEEKKMYQLSDKIGCMSPNNLEYLLKHNDCITEKNVEVFPNAINPINNSNNYDSKKHSVRKIYNIANDKTVFLYGGNLGKPQGINYISKVIKNFRKIEDAFLLIVGSGTEFDFIDRQISETGNPNIKLIEKLKKEEYDNLLSSVDIGLIFLDHRFTIPNFPSRLTSYLEHSLPIIAATDLYSDLGKIIENNKVGFWCESKGISDFLQIANILAKDKDLRIKMGQNGRKLLEEEYDITKTIEIILKHI